MTRLRQMLVNLLSNAVKFTERGEVVVSVHQPRRWPPTQHELHFAVRDTGIGIPADRMDRLFQSFSQVDASTTRRYGGTGLGLAISKRLCELMGGTMWVESTVGQGSTFHFTIARRSRAQPGCASTWRRNQPQLRGKRAADRGRQRDQPADPQPAGAVLGDDHRARPATAAEALDWIRQGEPFDLAILDMQMPEMDGITLAGEIRRLRDAAALAAGHADLAGAARGRIPGGRRSPPS